MTTYAWPYLDGWIPNQWEMRVMPNVATFTSPLSKSVQAIDLLGERWRIVMGLPPGTDPLIGGALEAFFDRLHGPVNLIAIGNLQRRAPLGTMRGSPTLAASASQLANTVSITGTGTLLAGDMIGIGGQLVRVMADATLPGTVEFTPRLRAAKSAGAAVTWDYPTANFRLAADGVPVAWHPGAFDGASAELIEDIG